jgi:aminopeptidase
LADPRIAKLAKLLVQYSLKVQPGQLIEIGGSPLALPLITEAYRQVLELGAHPYTRIQVPGLAELKLQHGNDEQLDFITPDERLGIEQTDGLLRVLSDTNTKSLSGVDPVRQQRLQRARTDLMQTMMDRAASGDLAWVLTLIPTDAYAQDAEMSLADYEEFVYGAGLLDADDPVAEWIRISTEQARLIDWLTGKQEIHIVAPDTDLRVGVAGRTWINADGKHNFPDGEIFTGPVETSASGHIRFTFPSSTGGREVEDIRLEFADGKVVNASASKNEEFLHKMLEADDGARFLGEFAFGTNRGIQRYTGNTLFDEKIGGTMHMAIGAGYPETGSQNKSTVHWDMICDLRPGSEVRVDGDLFMKDGQFTV